MKPNFQSVYSRQNSPLLIQYSLKTFPFEVSNFNFFPLYPLGRQQTITKTLRYVTKNKMIENAHFWWGHSKGRKTGQTLT